LAKAGLTSNLPQAGIEERPAQRTESQLPGFPSDESRQDREGCCLPNICSFIATYSALLNISHKLAFHFVLFCGRPIKQGDKIALLVAARDRHRCKSSRAWREDRM